MVEMMCSQSLKNGIRTFRESPQRRKNTTIRFMYDAEMDGKLPFLDLLPTITPSGAIDISIHRKTTAASRFIIKDSHCPASYKTAALRNIIQRLCRLP